MRKFTDSLLFGIMFILAAFGWWMMSLSGHIPALNPKELAPMTVGIVVIIAAPALLVATLLAFFRAVSNTNPKKFWGWGTFGTALTTGALAVSLWITDMQQLQLGFRTGVWFAAIFALVALIGLVLALTDAIPVPVKLTAEEKKAAKKQAARERKAEKRDQAKEDRAAKRQAEKAAKAQAKAESQTEDKQETTSGHPHLGRAQQEQIDFEVSELGFDDPTEAGVTSSEGLGGLGEGEEAIADWDVTESPQGTVEAVAEVEEVEDTSPRDSSKQ